MPNTLPKPRHEPVSATSISGSTASKEEAASSTCEEENEECSFRLISKIGQGGYGSVYLVQKNQGFDKNSIYALKVSKGDLNQNLKFALDVTLKICVSDPYVGKAKMYLEGESLF